MEAPHKMVLWMGPLNTAFLANLGPFIFRISLLSLKDCFSILAAPFFMCGFKRPFDIDGKT